MPIKPIEVYRRATTGPRMEEKEFDREILSKRVGELVKEYDIKYDPENPVPSDDSLLDDVWKAGYTFALEAGMYCTDTKRRIILSEEEIKKGLQIAIPPMRNIEDKEPMSLAAGPAGIPTPEEIFVPLHMSYAQEPGVDQLWSGALSTYQGMRVKVGTPLEIIAPRHEALMAKKVLERVGKPDLIILPAGATTYASFAGIADLDVLIPVLPSQPELKTNLSVITMYSIADELELAWAAGSMELIGTYAGPAGTLVMGVAVIILLYGIFGGGAAGCGTVMTDSKYSISTSRINLWPQSIFTQMCTKHNILSGDWVVPRAPTCTDMVLKEGVTQTIMDLASGASSSGGSGSGCAIGPASGLDYRIIYETNMGMAGINRKNANDLVKAILAMYEEMIPNPPKGKKFEECYDMKTVKPTKEWLDLYNKTKKELEDIGVEFKEAEK